MLALRDNEERSGRNRNMREQVVGVARAAGGVRAAGQQYRVTTPCRQTVTDMLRPRPLIPPIPSAMPQSMTQLLAENEYLGLGAYGLPSSRQSWPLRTKMAYSRRKYLYDILTTRATQMRNTTLDMQGRQRHIAANMDQEMKSRDLCNTSQYMKYLKSSDAAMKKSEYVRSMFSIVVHAPLLPYSMHWGIRRVQF